MASLGLRWAPIKAARRTYASYRTKAIRDYLITLDKYVKMIEAGDSKKVFIFMDESYVNIHHAQKLAFVPKDEKVDPLISRKSGKGKRLIILHVIGEDCPLVEIDEATGRPIDDLE